MALVQAVSYTHLADGQNGSNGTDGTDGHNGSDGQDGANGEDGSRPVFVYAYDFTAHGGSLSETNAAKIVKVQQLALKTGAPVIALNDSGGARIQEGVNRDVYKRQV